MGWTHLDQERFERENTAPEGAVWVCGACGKHGKRKDKIGDESCFLNAELCSDDKPEAVSPFQHQWAAWKEADAE